MTERVHSFRTLLMITIVGSVFLVSGCAHEHARAPRVASLEQRGFEGPWAPDRRAPAMRRADAHVWRVHHRRRGGGSSIVEVAYRFYSGYLTKVDGARCPHRPTCSRYSIHAIRKHGLIVGSWLTIDRLLRGDRSSVLRALPRRSFGGEEVYYVDPVSENDFFF